MSAVSIIAGAIASAVLGTLISYFLPKHLHKGRVVAGAIVAVIVFFTIQIVLSDMPSNKTSSTSSTSFPGDGRDVIQNLTLGILNPTVPIDGSAYAEIEIEGGTPGAAFDLEIAQPSYVDGGVCPEITPPITSKCDLVQGGGNTFDRDGKFTMKFPDPANTELHSGLYLVAVRDQHTGVIVESQISVD